MIFRFKFKSYQKEENGCVIHLYKRAAYPQTSRMRSYIRPAKWRLNNLLGRKCVQICHIFDTLDMLTKWTIYRSTINGYVSEHTLSVWLWYNRDQKFRNCCQANINKICWEINIVSIWKARSILNSAFGIVWHVLRSWSTSASPSTAAVNFMFLRIQSLPFWHPR